jgi:hypothetical protein
VKQASRSAIHSIIYVEQWAICLKTVSFLAVSACIVYLNRIQAMFLLPGERSFSAIVNIFRKEKPRPEKTGVLSMHLRQDPQVPELPTSLLNEAFNNDPEIQDLLKARCEIQVQQDQIRDDPEQQYNKVTYDAAIECIRRALNRRRIFLRKRTKNDFRQNYFKNPELVRSQYPSAHPPQRAWRAELHNALYFEDESKGSTLVAIEAIIAHCRSSGAVRDKGHPPQQENNIAPTAPEAGRNCSVKRKLTEEDTQKLVHLRRHLKLPWAEILTHFPGWSRTNLGYRYRKAALCEPGKGLSEREEPVAVVERQQANLKKRPYGIAVADIGSLEESRKRVHDSSQLSSQESIVARAVYNVETGKEEWVDV